MSQKFLLHKGDTAENSGLARTKTLMPAYAKATCPVPGLPMSIETSGSSFQLNAPEARGVIFTAETQANLAAVKAAQLATSLNGADFTVQKLADVLAEAISDDIADWTQRGNVIPMDFILVSHDADFNETLPLNQGLSSNGPIASL